MQYNAKQVLALCHFMSSHSNISLVFFVFDSNSHRVPFCFHYLISSQPPLAPAPAPAPALILFRAPAHAQMEMDMLMMVKKSWVYMRTKVMPRSGL